MRLDRAESIEVRASLQAARMLQARLPRALAITIASFLVVAILEVAAHPERTGTMALHLPAAIAALVVGTWLARWRASRAVWFIAAALSLFVAVVTSYFIRVGGQSETLAFGFVYLVFGAPIVLRWGVGPQTVVAAAAAGGYIIAVAVGLPSTTPLPIEVAGILSFAGLTIGTARSLARQQLDLLRRDEVKETLLAVASDLAESAELGDALERVQQRASTVLASDIVATYLLDAAGRSFHLAGAHGIPPDLRETAQSIDVAREATVFGSDLSRQQTLMINDVAQWPVLRPELMRQFGIRALLLTSLAVRDRSLGLFVAVRTSTRPFVEAEAQLFDSIGRQLGVAIEADEHDRREREEADVATALARVGRELISALDTRAVLQRLCRACTEVLGCDSSHAFLREKASGVFVVRAVAGERAERWESLRGLRLTEAQVEHGFGLFRDADVVHLGVPPPDPRWPPLPEEFGIAAALAVALRRGTELVGLFTVGRRRPQLFGPREERIALGIAHLASLALENARLMEELDSAHRVKSDFVANMSHELRTPLNVIMGYNELLGEGGFGTLSVEQLDVVERVGRRSRELLELINVTLDLSRIEAGSVPLAVCELNVAMLLRDLEMETQMTRKPRVELRWEVASGLPSIVTDPAKLRVIVRNVVMNAIKFTDEGTIRVGAVGLEDGVEIAVTDTGIGIPADMIEAIFEPFRQIDGTPGRGGGAGLGLHLSRRLVAMLGGRITVESELGRGSTFRIWMPRSKSGAEGEEVLPVSSEPGARAHGAR